MVFYTRSPLVEQTTPVFLPLVDQSALVSNITFPDLDLDFDDIGGTLFWIAPEDSSYVTRYEVHLTIEGNSSNRSVFGQANAVDLNMTVPVDTSLSPFTNFAVYTASALVEQTTPAIGWISDASAGVSNVSFSDRDLDNAEHGGVVSWTEPSSAGNGALVDVYAIYWMPADTAMSSSVHALVYTHSSLVEQATPADHRIFDEEALVSTITFPTRTSTSTTSGACSVGWSRKTLPW